MQVVHLSSAPMAHFVAAIDMPAKSWLQRDAGEARKERGSTRDEGQASLNPYRKGVVRAADIPFVRTPDSR